MGTTRVALTIQVDIETYDDEGRLLTKQPTGPTHAAALSAAALALSLEGLYRQLAPVWPEEGQQPQPQANGSGSAPLVEVPKA
jgi:hypothetical protein